MIDANIERILDDDAVGGRDVVIEVAVAGNAGQRVDACCIEPTWFIWFAGMMLLRN
jgi:hypothetical protein